MDGQFESANAVASGSRKSGKSHLHEQRSPSSSSSSSTSSSASSSSSCPEPPRDSKKKKKKTQRRRSKKQKKRDRRLDKLYSDVGELRKTVAFYESTRNRYDNGDEICMSDVSREMYDDCCASQVTASPENPGTISDLAFDIETKLKDPAVPQTPKEFIKMLDEVQKFGGTSWSDVRYSETQKFYNHSPGFTEMEINEEVRAYDNIRHLAYSDKSYAAITFCILKQKEVLLNSLRSLISWSRTADASLGNLKEKIDELFLKGDFHKVSTDLLQMACGHRAETIEMRRDGILKSVRDPLVKVTLNKIPPSNSHVFNQDAFTSALEKTGGVRKAFWPVNQPSGRNASRAKPNNAARHPSQGQARQNVPSHGHSNYYYDPPSNYMRCHHNQPSQGNYQFQQYPPKGQYNAGPDQRSYNPYSRGSSFRSRGSRPHRQSQRGQKRHYSPSGYKGNNKRQKQ